jgi:hypothetical protein
VVLDTADMLSFLTGACLMGKHESGSLAAKSSAILAGLVLMCWISLCKLCQLTSRCHIEPSVCLCSSHDRRDEHQGGGRGKEKHECGCMQTGRSHYSH